MKFLFIHQNFPGQFKFLAPALVRAGHEVMALTLREGLPDKLEGVTIRRYAIVRGSTPGVHPWAADIETKTIRGEACFRAMIALRDEGYVPDAVIANHGWGESLFVKDVWPQTRLGIYCEFFYRPEGLDMGFDPEFAEQSSSEAACRIRLKNLNNLAHMETADAAISPTAFQASTFPDHFRERITVVHDGIDTGNVRPYPSASLSLGSGLSLTRRDEVITFVNRNLEPARGYHSFMRALPEVLARRPEALVMIVGGDEVSYGAKAPDGTSWKEIYRQEAFARMTPEQQARVRFLGRIPYNHFVTLLQLSRVHVYLTYPFVLSWSLIEAMSAGCAIVGSDTTPVREAIRDGETGRLVDFFNTGALAGAICDLLENPAAREKLGKAARADAVARFDLVSTCLPGLLAWAEALARGKFGG